MCTHTFDTNRNTCGCQRTARGAIVQVVLVCLVRRVRQCLALESATTSATAAAAVAAEPRTLKGSDAEDIRFSAYIFQQNAASILYYVYVRMYVKLMRNVCVC